MKKIIQCLHTRAHLVDLNPAENVTRGPRTIEAQAIH